MIDIIRKISFKLIQTYFSLHTLQPGNVGYSKVGTKYIYLYE